MAALIQGLNFFVYFLIADAVLSWVMPAHKFPRSFTTKITAPLYAPFRAVLPPEKTGGFDISPIFLILLIQLVQRMLLGRI
jgi:YggT family protein